MITITTKLDMRHGAVRPTIHLSQYDSDFTLVFELYSSDGTFTVESGTTALIRGTKSSGTGFSADASINISTKTVTVTGDAQMTAAAGQNVYEITLYKGGKEINSANFLLLCERAALDADTITDESVLKELDAIIEGAETATQAAEDAEDAADRAEAAAQTLVIDPTLTKSGQAAGAKETGDKIDAVVGDVEQISEVVGTETVDDYEYVPVSFSISNSTSTVRAITFEQNTDGTVHVYGTNNSSTSRAIYKLTYNGSDMQLPIEGGETYRFSGRPSTDVDCTIDLRFATGGGVYVDRGGGVTFTPEESNTYYIAIAIGAGASIDAVFSPKLEKLQIVGQKTINVLSAKDTVARDEISGLESVVENFEGISDEVKVALLNCFKNVAWKSDTGQNFYDALYNALYNALPSGYTPCDYIVAGLISEEKNANEIITNYHMNSNTRILFKGSMNLSIDASTHNCSLFTDHSADGYGLSIHYETGKEWIDSYRGGARYRITDAAIGLDTVYDYELWPDNSIKRNDTIIKSDATDGGKTSGNPMYIFGDFHRGSKLYSFTVYENDEVVANYKPCVRKSDGMVGLYDVISGKFFGNANLTAMQNS